MVAARPSNEADDNTLLLQHTCSQRDQLDSVIYRSRRDVSLPAPEAVFPSFQIFQKNNGDDFGKLDRHLLADEQKFYLYPAEYCFDKYRICYSLQYWIQIFCENTRRRARIVEVGKSASRQQPTICVLQSQSLVLEISVIERLAVCKRCFPGSLVVLSGLAVFAVSTDGMFSHQRIIHAHSSRCTLVRMHVKHYCITHGVHYKLPFDRNQITFSFARLFVILGLLMKITGISESTRSIVLLNRVCLPVSKFLA